MNHENRNVQLTAEVPPEMILEFQQVSESQTQANFVCCLQIKDDKCKNDAQIEIVTYYMYIFRIL